MLRAAFAAGSNELELGLRDNQSRTLQVKGVLSVHALFTGIPPILFGVQAASQPAANMAAQPILWQYCSQQGVSIYRRCVKLVTVHQTP